MDISDPTRWYDDEELSALSSATRNYILQHPDRQKAIDERKKERAKRRNTSATEASSKRTNDEQGALITAVVNAQRNAAAVNAGVNYPQNGSSRRTNAATRSNPPSQVSTNGSAEASVLTFDHLGNIVE